MAFKLFKRDIKRDLKEMNSSALQSLRTANNGGIRPTPTTSVLDHTGIDYDKVRKLYYNKDQQLSNGAFFAKPLVNGIADHIGMPLVTLQDEQIDQRVQGWIDDRWRKQLWEIYRNCLRDSKCWVRLRKPLDGPYTADDERDDVVIEVLDADSVSPYYDPFTNELTRVEIATDVYVEENAFDPTLVQGRAGRNYGRVHRIIEIVTADQYLYYDETKNEMVESSTLDNTWGFVPFVEVFNDYDSALHGGTSVLENVYPFFKAFHDVIVQTRQAHAYHADPKVKFKLDDVMSFLRNNFKEAFDSDGNFSGQISWKGKDVYFMESEEDVGFIEATLNTGESVSLLEFLVDCICMAGEVTEAILFRAKSSTVGETDELFRFKARIQRSRDGFAEYLQTIVKMALKISTGNVTRLPAISWRPMQTADLVAEGTAMNQIITASEVANRAGVITRSTYRSRIREFFPHMKDDTTEENTAQTEQQVEQQRQLEYETQAAALRGHNIPAPSSNGQLAGQNGGGSRSRIKLPIDVIPSSSGN